MTATLLPLPADLPTRLSYLPSPAPGTRAFSAATSAWLYSSFSALIGAEASSPDATDRRQRQQDQELGVPGRSADASGTAVFRKHLGSFIDSPASLTGALGAPDRPLRSPASICGP